ncbi:MULTISPECIES: HPP family protein [unclassified Agrobacterium]|uniref:HPP family protein n=1 Tax=unclassified Agrobacterium TaxID=2632611 RepID=UPI0024473D36|nr:MULTISPECIES: HPP family protein [unclassified Agrobacterium]MDH0614095.1 HPP family protein [Agrobacterium sp. GD03872]MDH0695610.1 HPP family protein [Agrobacterium sp. GD03871]MDH1058512.1 HPP family protein [Agrobacterium sp. GD03992]MDH2209546.1 HPP family protein [Agrobacterium sp. GD03643]MDH2218950.1 HPP family protein [Agrobacterium sp. GD03638]
MRSTLRRFIPDAAPVSNRERLRSATGAFVGILLTGLLGSLALRFDPTLPAMIAPMGASAVLLFAVPSSPLAQPWSILCGNLVSAFVGVTVALLVPDPFFASALAISLAIAAMMALRCLHPPSGAVALTAVLGGPAVHSLGYGFLLWPVAGNSLILLALALAYNNATGRAYPHGLKLGKAAHGTTDPTPIQKIGFSSTDLDEVLREYDEFIDIDRDALETILRKTELRSYRRRALHLDCESVMSRDVVGVAPDDSLRHAHALMRSHHFKALPVTNDSAEIVGIVTQTDFLEKASWRNGRPSIGFLQRLRLILSAASAPNDTVKDIMTSPVKAVRPETPIEEAIIRFAEDGLHYLPVIDARGKMVGIVSQSDVMVAMLADKVAA